MKRIGMYAIIASILLLASIPMAMAVATGTLRISPTWPVMVTSPAEFTIWSQAVDSYSTAIDFVVSEDCYNGMPDTGNVIEVEYGAAGVITSQTKADFVAYTLNSAKYPDFPNVVEGAKYTIASLKDHLDEGGATIGPNDTIYIADYFLGHADFDPLQADVKRNITVTLTSSEHRMLVYLHGKSEDGGQYDLKVPPTNPGFVVPEVATIFLAGTSFAGLGLYAIKQKRKLSA
jgi:hypothetical protein